MKRISCFILKARKQIYYTMKKNLVYTMTFLLIGTFMFSSCQDMLNADSDRVEYEYNDWSANDSVFSVLGILKSVQGIADRHILLNELRADLVVPSNTEAVVDIQELCNSNFTNSETNKYLSVKDYYTVINNCNVYLNRVDTTLNKNGIYYMMPEYVAVKSMRAWTYLQLAINHNEIPYFEEPITTHSAAQAVLDAPKLSRVEVMDKLIEDILPYENPVVYTMPAWDDGGKIITFGYKNTTIETSKLFVPIRMLLGEMYLWKGDYKNAAKYFYAQITGEATNNKAPRITDNSNHVKYGDENGKNLQNSYSSLFALENYSSNANKYLAVVPFANSELLGSTSELAAVFSPQNDLGGAQVFASPGFVGLSQSQKYRYIKGDPKKPEKSQYGDSYEYPGDLRIKATTYSQTDNDVLKTEYKNIIAKFNLESSKNFNMNFSHVPSINTSLIVLQRAELAYLRFAEALLGLEQKGYEGAMEFAMTILKSGAKDKYRLIQNPVYKDSVALNAAGDTIWKYSYGDDGKKSDSIEVRHEYLAKSDDIVDFDFTNTVFTSNFGIHSRGTGGDAEHNAFYALDTLCVARYNGDVDQSGITETIKPGVKYENEDFVKYVADLILDELALELSWEGFRFGDLVRFAEAYNDPDMLAMRIAGRNYPNLVRYRNSEGFEYDPAVYSKMLDKQNWYLPLPDEVVEPAENANENK